MLLLAWLRPEGEVASSASDAGRVSYGLGYNTVESLAGQLEGDSMAKPPGGTTLCRAAPAGGRGSLNDARDSIVERRQAEADVEAASAAERRALLGETKARRGL